MANEFNDAAAGQLDTVSSRMDPRVYIKRKHLILVADDKLNQFQVSHTVAGLSTALIDSVLPNSFSELNSTCYVPHMHE
jgi:hypothetical protein